MPPFPNRLISGRGAGTRLGSIWLKAVGGNRFTVGGETETRIRGVGGCPRLSNITTLPTPPPVAMAVARSRRGHKSLAPSMMWAIVDWLDPHHPWPVLSVCFGWQQRMRLVIVIVFDVAAHDSVSLPKKMKTLDILAECMPSLPHSMTIWVGAKGCLVRRDW